VAITSNVQCARFVPGGGELLGNARQPVFTVDIELSPQHHGPGF